MNVASKDRASALSAELPVALLARWARGLGGRLRRRPGLCFGADAGELDGGPACGLGVGAAVCVVGLGGSALELFAQDHEFGERRQGGHLCRVEFLGPLQDLVGGRNAGRVGFWTITGRLPSAVHSSHRGISARVNADARQKLDRTHVCVEKATERSKLYVSVPETSVLRPCLALPGIRGSHFPPAGSSANRSIFRKAGKTLG
ncbi:hypothetical protein [Streptomyces sp. MJP52]|uniref:hypothetical protein n=1 Tax=Streptomyces sp. MJP52 TaxID=2940555 RepID=UPI00247729B5|nr:hypothetical protein [Streptomyces sp. MJP52]MDH6228950.1 hypothetical protein [Streptomyces sp. MJP52]